MSTSVDTEVAVVGAGPAGSAAALTLARSGLDVLLIDKRQFPRDKACGDVVSGVAVRFLNEAGLKSFVERFPAIGGVRLIDQFKTANDRVRFVRNSSELPPRCIPRMQLDAALLGVAIEHGATFVHGRVERISGPGDGRRVLVIRRPDGSLLSISARVVVGADGATSRIRREVSESGAPFGEKAFAIRQYIEVTSSLEPLLDLWRPIHSGQKRLPGYGWMFPVSETVANVGVGFFRRHRRDLFTDVSLRRVLTEFFSLLRSRDVFDTDEFRLLSKPLGAPVAVGFNHNAVEFDRLVLAGDAARMTDPYIGEGIAEALLSGQAAARWAVSALKATKQKPFGHSMSERFPRLGHDVGPLLRAREEVFEHGKPREASSSDKSQSSLIGPWFVKLMIATSEPFDFSESPLVKWAETENSAISKRMNSIETLARNHLRTEFPFATELILRRISSAFGPTISATACAVQFALGIESDDKISEMSLATELLGAAIETISTEVGNETSKRNGVADGLATLIADFALGTGLQLASRLGTEATTEFSRVAQSAIQGAAIESEDRWNTDRTTESYMRSIELGSAALHGFASLVGNRLAIGSPARTDIIEYGRQLGLAIALSSDTIDLLAKRRSIVHSPGDGLRSGKITLPVIFAIEEDPGISGFLTPNLDNESFEAIVHRIRETNAAARCQQACEALVAASISALKRSGLRSATLERFAQLPLDLIRQIK